MAAPRTAHRTAPKPETDRIYDLLIVGGGIQGACLARDAAGRGLDVALVERGDLACGTSSASSKLIHGGLRYLEQRRFRLVRESLTEREVLLKTAPHLVQPLRFVLPHTSASRPAWMLRAGLFFYDHLGGASSLPGSKSVSLPRSPLGDGLAPDLERGFVYSDCFADDARLVVANARAAADLGARIQTRIACAGAYRTGDHWTVQLKRMPATRMGGENDTAFERLLEPSQLTGEAPPMALSGFTDVRARALVNAAGPWAARMLRGPVPYRGMARLRLVQGSHVVVPRLLEGEHALTLQCDDGRVVFVLPFEQRYSLVGTTEVAMNGKAPRARTTPEEVDYLCAVVSRFLQRDLSPDDVLWSFSGVRPLYETGDGSDAALSREDVIEIEDDRGVAPLLSIFGGKLTTARRVAERALDRLAAWLPSAGPAWTSRSPLPGGGTAADVALRALCNRFPELPHETLAAVVRRHGDLAASVLSHGPLGEELLPTLFEAEVDYMVAQEWAMTADDVLWRRSKLGLVAEVTQREAVAQRVTKSLKDHPPRTIQPAGQGRR